MIEENKVNLVWKQTVPSRTKYWFVITVKK